MKSQMIHRYVEDVLMSEDPHQLTTIEWSNAFEVHGEKYKILNDLANELILNKQTRLQEQYKEHVQTTIKPHLIQEILNAIASIDCWNQRDLNALSDAIKYQVLLKNQTSWGESINLIQTVTDPRVIKALLLHPYISMANKIMLMQNIRQKSLTQNILYHFLNQEGMSQDDKKAMIQTMNEHPQIDKILYKIFKNNNNFKDLISILDTKVLLHFLLKPYLSDEDRLKIFHDLSPELQTSLENKGANHEVLAALSQGVLKQQSRLSLNSRLIIAYYDMCADVPKQVIVSANKSEQSLFSDMANTLHALIRDQVRDMSQKIRVFENVTNIVAKKLDEKQQGTLQLLKDSLMSQIKVKNIRIITQTRITFSGNGLYVLKRQRALCKNSLIYYSLS